MTRTFSLAATLGVLLLARPAEAQVLACEEETTPFGAGWLVDRGPAACDDNRWLLDGEYVVWWFREGRIPPLLTTSPAASLGLLGEPDTHVVYGDEKLDTRKHIGVRLTARRWFDDGQTLGLQVGAFFLERYSTNLSIGTPGDPVLARPLIDPTTGGPAVEVVSGPSPQGPLCGRFNGFSKIELFGQEGNLVAPLVRDETVRIEGLVGVRFLQFRERLDLTATSKLLPDEAVIFADSDHYRVYDRFYGGQVGLDGEYRLGRWFIQLRTRAALGGTEQIVKAYGDRTVHTPLARTVEPFGLLVRPSNAGRSTHVEFDAVYELGLNVGLRLTDHLRVYGGYTLLYWTNPIRPGDQVDLAVNPNLAAPSSRPTIPFRDDFFWAQGLNVGTELRW